MTTKADYNPRSKSEHGTRASSNSTRTLREGGSSPAWFARLVAYNDELDCSLHGRVRESSGVSMVSASTLSPGTSRTDEQSEITSRKGAMSFEVEDLSVPPTGGLRFSGSRLRCLFHRSWFVENKKRQKGFRAHHPLVLKDGTRRILSTVGLDLMIPQAGSISGWHSKEKAWERVFASFLELEEQRGLGFRAGVGTVSGESLVWMGGGPEAAECSRESEKAKTRVNRASSDTSSSNSSNTQGCLNHHHHNHPGDRRSRGSSSIFAEVAENLIKADPPSVSRRHSPAVETWWQSGAGEGAGRGFGSDCAEMVTPPQVDSSDSLPKQRGGSLRVTGSNNESALSAALSLWALAGSETGNCETQNARSGYENDLGSSQFNPTHALRSTYTSIHNSSAFAADAGSAFLGDEPSTHPGRSKNEIVQGHARAEAGTGAGSMPKASAYLSPNAQNYSPELGTGTAVSTSVPAVPAVPAVPTPISQSLPHSLSRSTSGPSLPISASLQDLLRAGTIAPSGGPADPPPLSCLIKMPPVRSRRELGDGVGAIASNAWILPYVFACAPPHVMQYLANLPCVFGYQCSGVSADTNSAGILNGRVECPKGNLVNVRASSAPFSISRAGSESSNLAISVTPPPPPTPVAASPFATNARSSPIVISQGGMGAGSSTEPIKKLKLPQTAQAGVPVSDGAKRNSFDGNPTQENTCQASPMPPPPQHWFSLGVVWLCRDPSWRVWEQRAVFVCHNYLFECLPDLRHGIIGFAMLAGAQIALKRCGVLTMATTGADAVDSPDFATGTGTGPDPTRPILARTDTEALHVTVLTRSKSDSERASFWVRGPELEDLPRLSRILRASRDLSLDDCFDLACVPEGDQILGRGRYNEVRMARRRAIRSANFGIKVRNEAGGEEEGGLERCEGMDEDESYNIGMTFSIDHDHDQGQGQDQDQILPFMEQDDDGTGFGSDSTGDLCALKLVSKEIFWKRVNLGKERGDSLIREVLSQALACDAYSAMVWEWVYGQPHAQPSSNPAIVHVPTPTSRSPVVSIFSVFETIEGFAVEMELMEQWDLFDKLSIDGVFPEDLAKHVVLQLIDAVALCNSLGIAHRDVKLSNITFPRRTRYDMEEEAELARILGSRFGTGTGTATGQNHLLSPPTLFVKLADFGMAGFIGTDNALKGRCGTPGYVAPEILKANAHESYGLNVDMFSIGVVAYTLLCGYEPFYGADDLELVRANKNIEYEFHLPEWGNISPMAKDWISRTLCGAGQRMSPVEAREHEWLADAVTVERLRSERAVRLKRQGDSSKTGDGGGLQHVFSAEQGSSSAHNNCGQGGSNHNSAIIASASTNHHCTLS